MIFKDTSTYPFTSEKIYSNYFISSAPKYRQKETDPIPKETLLKKFGEIDYQLSLNKRCFEISLQNERRLQLNDNQKNELNNNEEINNIENNQSSWISFPLN